MSLLWNMLSRLVITFLPRSKHLNFMAAVTICSDFGAPQNKVWLCFHCFPMKWWDKMPWSSFSECWDLSQLFHSLLSLSSRSFLVYRITIFSVVLKPRRMSSVCVCVCVCVFHRKFHRKLQGNVQGGPKHTSQSSPVLTSCISIIQYQNQEIDISKIHRNFSYFSSPTYTD